MARDDRNKSKAQAFDASDHEFDDVEFGPIVMPTGETAQQSQHMDLGEWFWKYVASGSTATPSSVLSALATDRIRLVRRRCAENPHTNSQALSLLAEDADETVRAAVARNKRTPVYLVRQLCQDPSASVRYAVAANREMPDAILLSLFLDSDPYVAERASQTLAA